MLRTRIIDPDVQCKKMKIAIVENDIPMIQALLEDMHSSFHFPNENSIDFSDKNGKTALSLACELKSTEIVELLLKHKATVTWEDFNKAEPCTPIQLALLPHLIRSNCSVQPSLFELIYSAVAKDENEKALRLAKYIDYLAPELKQEIVTKAIDRFNLPLLSKLGVDISSWRSPQGTFLHHAILQINVEAIEFILNNTQIDINQQNDSGETALYLAVGFAAHDDKMVRMLLSKGANPNIVTKHNQTPLCNAIQHEVEGVVRVLLNHGADPSMGNPGALNDALTASKSIKQLFSSYLESEDTNCDAPRFSYNYTQQIVIDYTGYAQGLKNKWDARHTNPCRMINGSVFEARKGKMNIPFSRNDVIRIYIHAHCKPGANTLTGSDGGDGKEIDHQIHFKMLAQNLANLIGNHKAVINLTGCGGGKGNIEKVVDDTSFNSFAAKLHRELVFRMQRDIPVVARTHYVNVFILNGNKSTTLLNLPWESPSELHNQHKHHHQPGSKVAFVGIKEARLDVYSYNWKEDVIEAIENAEKHTKLKKTSDLLTKWLAEFPTMRPKEIFAIISSELNNKDSILKEHSAFFLLPTRFFDTSTHKKLLPLVVKGKPIFDSTFTVEHPVTMNITPCRL